MPSTDLEHWQAAKTPDAAVLPGSADSTLEAVAVPVRARLTGNGTGMAGGTTMGDACAGGAENAVGRIAANKPSAAAQASPAVVVLFSAFNRLLT